MKLAISVARPNLMSLGTCLGKFSKSGKFKLHITALDYLAQYAKFKVRCPAFCLPTYSLNQRFQVWIKPNGEMSFLYGNHVLKNHLGRITEDTPEHQGVVVYSMSDVPLVRTKPVDLFLYLRKLQGVRCNGAVHRRYKKA